MERSNTYYYANKSIFGAEGDFITAPEISQIFGEMVGIWLLLQCEKYATTTPHIIELGPGRGTLMKDILRVFKRYPHYRPNIHLVETSQNLQDIQKKILLPSTHSISWHKDFPKIMGPTFIIANEFFDALPLQQYFFQYHQWHEVHVNYDEAFHIVFSPVDQKDLPINADEGAFFETSPASHHYAKKIADYLHHHGGAALLIDYGDYIPQNRFGETFQALSQHRYVNPFDYLGEADLTYQVDFAALDSLFKKYSLATHFSTQRDFLKAHGFEERLSKILSTCSDASIKKDQYIRAQRLVHPEAMGQLFKALEIFKI